MCYKNDIHEKLEQKLSEEIKDVPRFISGYLTTLRSSRTKSNNWGIVRNMLEFFIDRGIIKRESIHDILPADFKNIIYTDIIEYLKSNTKLKTSTILIKKAVLGGFWEHLRCCNCVDRNIVYEIKKGTFRNEETEKEVEIPTREQLDQFITNIKIGNRNEFDCARNLAIVSLFIGSGIRCEELIGLDIGDLHLDEAEPYIMVMGKGKQELQDRVSVSEDAVDDMKEYLDYREEFLNEKSKQGKATDTAAVFLSNAGNRISKTAIRSFFSRYSCSKIYPHMLRHLCGTMIYNKTKDIKIVQQQLRHRNEATSSRYYIHTAKSDVQEAVSGLTYKEYPKKCIDTSHNVC